MKLVEKMPTREKVMISSAFSQTFVRKIGMHKFYSQKKLAILL